MEYVYYIVHLLYSVFLDHKSKYRRKNTLHLYQLFLGFKFYAYTYVVYSYTKPVCFVKLFCMFLMLMNFILKICTFIQLQISSLHFGLFQNVIIIVNILLNSHINIHLCGAKKLIIWRIKQCCQYYALCISFLWMYFMILINHQTNQVQNIKHGIDANLQK